MSLDSGEDSDDQNAVKMARVRKLIAKKTQNAAVDGDVEKINKVIKDDEYRVDEAEEVPALTVQDVMPQGEKDQVDRNPEMPVHTGEGLIDFVLVMDIHTREASGKAKGMTLPDSDTFRCIVNTAITNMVTINMGWCNVVMRSGVTKAGLGLLQLNYGYPDGLAVFRDSVQGQSTDHVTYNLYPAVDLIKKYGVSVFIHPGYKGIPNVLFGGGLKGGNPDMKGDFEVVDSTTLKQEGKEDCRILSLNCSKEFLDYLATKPRNHRYRMFDHHVYINGGKRSDSVSEYTAPNLSPEAAEKLILSNVDTIMRHAARRQGLGQAFEEALKYYTRNNATRIPAVNVSFPLSFLSTLGVDSERKQTRGTEPAGRSKPMERS